MLEEHKKIVLGKKTDVHHNVYEERFHMLMKLIRIDRMMKRAKPLDSTPKN
jgi:hypothetical protein